MPASVTTRRVRRVRRAAAGVTLSALAVGALSAGALSSQDDRDPAAAALAAAALSNTPSPQALEDRDDSASRSASRTEVDPAKQALLTRSVSSGGQVVRTEKVEKAAPVTTGDPKSIAMSMLGQYGWSSGEFSCLESLWEKESGWDPSASNPSSGAYGIPQSLPGSKMASAGADWQTNPATQIEWGLGYIRDSYGSPCAAWGHSQSNGWY